MADSTRTAKKKLGKPHKDFPLFPHATGRWAKKVRGKFHYFGKTDTDPEGKLALELWLEQKDDLLAGRTPRANQDGLTVRDLCNHFVTAKEQQRDAGDIAPRTFAEYFNTGKLLVDSFGKRRLVSDLVATDFQSLRASLAKKYGVHRLDNEIQRIRTLLKYAYDSGLIEKPVRVGPTFKKPPARTLRAHRQKSGPRMFEAAELRTLIKAADQPLRAMIHLAINCAFGNNDCGTLPLSALDLDAGWVNYPRPKTAIERRCPLWPETIAELKEAIALRPKPKLAEHSGLVFVTKYGKPWAKNSPDSPVTKEFRKLLDSQKMHRPGLGFYAIRHTFQTIADGCLDRTAVSHIMGHADDSMAAVYRECISDQRLLDASNTVRTWLLGAKKPK